MKRKGIFLLLALSLLLTGCGWLDGSYVSVTPHREQQQTIQTGAVSASNYQELMAALENLIAAGTESAVIGVGDYPAESLESGMSVAVRYALDSYPLGAYAVEEIHYDLGTSGGQPALAVSIAYRHNRAEIQRIRTVENMDMAQDALSEALKGYASGVVLLVEDFYSRDFTQMVQDYATQFPELVMETPQVAVNLYGTGKSRVVELLFTYQNSRDVLRQMKSQVEPVFSAAALYVSGDGADSQKYAQLYAFLMERFDYTIETSITPAYSLLRHGVGDSRAFATVYAAMCRAAGLECDIITGTFSGEPRTWNLVLDNGYYYHVDLLRSSASGGFREYTDLEMRGYVWDYSAYPVCTGAPEPADTEPVWTGAQEGETEPPETEPETTAEPAPEDETEPPTENMEEF